MSIVYARAHVESISQMLMLSLARWDTNGKCTKDEEAWCAVYAAKSKERCDERAIFTFSFRILPMFY